MATIITEKRKRGADAVYIKQRYKNPDGNTKQKKIPCQDILEARTLLPLVNEAEKEGKEYLPIQAIRYVPLSSSGAKYGKLHDEYSSLTVAELLPLYFAYAAEKKLLHPNSLNKKKGLVKNHILPYIGKVKISEITPAFIQDYFDDLPNYKAAQGNHKTPPTNNGYRTIAEVRKVLSRAFKFAVTKLHAIPSNPITADIEVPKPPLNKRQQWSADELVDAMKVETSPAMKAFTMLMPAGPFRNAELLGLCWDCVHIPTDVSEENPASIEVKRELQRVYIEDLEATNTVPYILFPAITAGPKSQLAILETTKTARSRRTIYLPMTVTETLIDLKRHQDEVKADLGKAYTDYNLVFALEERFPGRPVSNETVNRWFKALKVTNNFRDVTLYSLRGTGTSQKLRATGNSKLVQTDMGGDSEKVMMDHYAIAEEADRKALAATMDSRLFSHARKERRDETK